MSYKGSTKLLVSQLRNIEKIGREAVNDSGSSTTGSQMNEIEQSVSNEQDNKTIRNKIKTEHPSLYKKYVIRSLLLAISTVLLLVIIPLGFLPVQTIATAPHGPIGELVYRKCSPMLTPVTCSYYFVVLLPIFISILLNVVNWVRPTKYLFIGSAVMTAIAFSFSIYLGVMYKFDIGFFVALCGLLFVSLCLNIFSEIQDGQKRVRR